MGRPGLSLPEELGAGRSAGQELVVGRRTDGGAPTPRIVRWFETWATGGRDGE